MGRAPLPHRGDHAAGWGAAPLPRRRAQPVGRRGPDGPVRPPALADPPGLRAGLQPAPASLLRPGQAAVPHLSRTHGRPPPQRGGRHPHAPRSLPTRRAPRRAARWDPRRPCPRALAPAHLVRAGGTAVRPRRALDRALLLGARRRAPGWPSRVDRRLRRRGRSRPVHRGQRCFRPRPPDPHPPVRRRAPLAARVCWRSPLWPPRAPSSPGCHTSSRWWGRRG